MGVSCPCCKPERERILSERDGFESPKQVTTPRNLDENALNGGDDDPVLKVAQVERLVEHLRSKKSLGSDEDSTTASASANASSSTSIEVVDSRTDSRKSVEDNSEAQVKKDLRGPLEVDVPVKTLGDLTDLPKERSLRGQKRIGLSSVPEAEIDITYHFTFYVIGCLAHRSASAACGSWASRKLQRRRSMASSMSGDSFQSCCGESPELIRTMSSTSLSRFISSGSGREYDSLSCLSRVPFPSEKQEDERWPIERHGLAQLLFNFCADPSVLHQEPPRFRSNLEASSSCIVFILVVDDPDGATFDEQLQDCRQIIQSLCFHSVPRNRPMCAAVLCQAQDQAPKAGISEEKWLSRLKDLDNDPMRLFKFGPIHIENLEAFHAVFSTIASDGIEARCLRQVSQ